MPKKKTQAIDKWTTTVVDAQCPYCEVMNYGIQAPIPFFDEERDMPCYSCKKVFKLNFQVKETDVNHD